MTDRFLYNRGDFAEAFAMAHIQDFGEYLPNNGANCGDCV